MITKLLVANRGEIAVRIIRAAREMGIETVAVYSQADADALHTQLADQAICIGPAQATKSYLNMEAIISATMISGAQAIHPGFGFLSENTKFVKMCEECNIIFIGPSSDIIKKMGHKQEARKSMQAAKVPIIPGSEETLEDAKAAYSIAKKIGYPLIIKAALGGGGKGMRVVYHKDDFITAFQTAQKEAMANFGSGSMYLEHFVQNPRHIEFQILADQHGNVVHLGERDCSVQRNHQKMIEESPSVAMHEKLRERMGQAAVKAAKAVGYTNAGTIEFLLEGDDQFYFMEMNTRIQVEHPVTEWVTGIDLIKEQIRVACGEKLGYTQDDIRFEGHAIECRINAENPAKGFRPSPGQITDLVLPGGHGVRIDSAIYHGAKVSPHYDSMIAKLIVHASDRPSAIAKMRRALGEFLVDGIDTNIDYQHAILGHEHFRSGAFDINFVEKHGAKILEALECV